MSDPQMSDPQMSQMSALAKVLLNLVYYYLHFCKFYELHIIKILNFFQPINLFEFEMNINHEIKSLTKNDSHKMSQYCKNE
jgi:hypothetical protein